MREIYINLTIIFNGVFLLLEKKENWISIQEKLEINETSMSCIKRIILEKLGESFDDIIDKYEINQDSLIQPWKVNTKNNKIILYHGICFSGEELPQKTIDNLFWVNLEEAHKLSIENEDKNLIKNYINYTNDDLEKSKIIKLYRDSIS